MTEKKTAEKILRQSKTAAEILRLKYADDKWEPIFSNIVAAMEEYAAQQSKMPTEIYAAIFNPMIHESGFVTLSIHKTRRGAEMAMEFHKAATIDEDGKLDNCKIWDVVKMKIED